MAYYTHDELKILGFSQVGKDVLVSDKTSLYNCKKIQLGSNVRIDDFCVLSAGEGGIKIGSYVHIAPFCSIMGAGKIEMSDFSGLSSKVSIYSSSDDYSGRFLTNPTVPLKYKGVCDADVFLGKHVIVGSGSVILPGVIIDEGAAVGAMSLVTKKCRSFGIYSGVPAKFIRERKRDLLRMEEELLKSFI